MTSRSLADKVTFVCCIESGPLEAVTLLLAESLRKWGGAFSQCPLVAVTPRFGPPLTRVTRRRLGELDVEHLRVMGRHSWFGFLNKPYAIAAVEARATTPQLAWIDGDMLVLGEPTDLLLEEEQDFAACAFDKSIGSTGPNDPFDRYWQEVAKVFQIDVDSLPWVVTEEEQARIRCYWNSGLFIWRRSVGLARQFLEDCTRLLESSVASAEAGIYFTDQVALGFTMVKLKLRWRALSYAYNYALGTKIAHLYDSAKFRQTRILHYHDVLWPHSWQQSMQRIKADRPDVYDWLLPRGPLRTPASVSSRMLSRVLKYWRDRRVRACEAKCQRY
jgi:hypothetical protein